MGVSGWPATHVTVMANPNYFGDGPYLGQVIYKYIPDLTVMYTLFKTGDIDFVSYQYITPDNLSDAENPFRQDR